MEDGRTPEPGAEPGHDTSSLSLDEQKYRIAANNFPDALFVNDARGDFIEVNDQACRSLGYSRDELLGMNITEVDSGMPSEKLEKLRERPADSIGIKIDSEQRRKDGSVFPVEIISACVPMNGEKIFVSSVRDVTEQRRREANLRQSTETIRALLNATQDAVVLIDKDGVICDLNNQMAARLNAPNETLLGQNVFALVPPAVGERRRQWLAEMIDDMEPRKTIEQLGDVWLESSAYPVLDGDGQLTHVAIFSRDITELKIANDAQKATQAELERRVRERTSKLRRSEQIFRDYAESAADRFWETDRDHRYVYVSKNNPIHVMLPGGSVIGKRRWELDGTDPDPEYWRQHWDDLKHQRAFRDFRYQITGPKGTPINVKASGKPIYDDNGDFVGYRGTVVDETSEILAAEEAEGTREIFLKAMENLQEGLLLWGPDQKFVYANKFFRQKHKFCEGFLTPETTYEQFMWRLSEEDWESIKTTGREVYVQRALDSYEDTSKVIVDRLGDMVTSVRKARMSDGSILVFFADISEQEEREAELQHQTALFESLFRDVPDATVLCDVDRRVVLSNPAFTDTFGYGADEIRGLPTSTFYESDAEFHRQGTLRFNQNAERQSKPYIVRYRRKNGDVFPAETVGTAVTDDQGRTLGYLGVMRDISERLQAEELLRQAQKMEAVGQLTGGVAHDFNNLLAAILGNLELIANRVEDNPELLRRVERAIKAAQTGGTLTNRLLAFSRRQSLDAQITELNDLVIGMNDMLERSLGEGVDIRLQLDPSVDRILVDQNQLETAILNIALNARDAMPLGGSITFCTSQAEIDQSTASNWGITPGPHAILSVLDTGEGIPPSAMPHIFEPFFTTKDVGEGSGLGLSMVFGFAKQSGGHLQVTSDRGLGTDVTLYFPITTFEPDKLEPDNADSNERLPTGRGRRIYLVEDDLDVREATTAMLQSMTYEVIDGKDGTDVHYDLDLLQDVDLLLTDMILSQGRTGIDIAVSAMAKYPGLKVVMMTGYSAELAEDGLNGLSIPILRKPFKMSELAAVLAGQF